MINKHLVIGIHKGYDPKKKLNVATIIDKKMVAELKSWASEFRISNVFINSQGE
jgi:hypothetical protein